MIIYVKNGNLEISISNFFFSTKMSAKLQKAKQEALWGMFIADALAMPVHWYYNPSDIKSGYGGWLTGYQAPEEHHPSSILTISATGTLFKFTIQVTLRRLYMVMVILDHFYLLQKESFV